MARVPSTEKSSTSARSSLRAREGTDARIPLALELMHLHCGRELTVGEIAGRLAGLSASDGPSEYLHGLWCVDWPRGASNRRRSYPARVRAGLRRRVSRSGG